MSLFVLRQKTMIVFLAEYFVALYQDLIGALRTAR